jgi:hypothetical protein
MLARDSVAGKILGVGTKRRLVPSVVGLVFEGRRVGLKVGHASWHAPPIDDEAAQSYPALKI